MNAPEILLQYLSKEIIDYVILDYLLPTRHDYVFIKGIITTRKPEYIFQLELAQDCTPTRLTFIEAYFNCIAYDKTNPKIYKHRIYPLWYIYNTKHYGKRPRNINGVFAERYY